MNCLACGTQDSRVVKSLDDGTEVRRRRQCACGAFWFTREVSDQKTLRATNGQAWPPTASKQPPVAAPGRGGVGGGLPSGSDLGPDLGPTSPGDPNRARARSKRPAKPAPPPDAPLAYPEPFEEVWAATDRRGGKADAFKAWVKIGRWPWRLLKPAWDAYMLSERPVKLGAVKDLSTWLNGNCHRQEWPPYVAAPPRAAASADPPWVAAQREEEARKRREAAETAAARERFEALERGAG